MTKGSGAQCSVCGLFRDFFVQVLIWCIKNTSKNRMVRLCGLFIAFYASKINTLRGAWLLNGASLYGLE